MKIPLAWFQLIRSPIRLLVALAGISFADILMFMQLGFQEALFESNTRIHKALLGDLVVISSQSKALHDLKPFSRRRLYQALSLPQVESIVPAYIGAGAWKNPDTGDERFLMLLALEPDKPILNLPQVNQQLDRLKLGNTVLFDKASRPEFGAIAEKWAQGQIVKTELSGRQITVGGLVELGTSFAFDGNVLLSMQSFLNIFPEQDKNMINLGVIHLKSHTNHEKVYQQLVSLLPQDIQILTRQEFIDWEKEYWATSTAIGFIFIIGTAMGCFVGIIIVYQILYTDISNHLPEYATLKAIGYTQSYLLGVIFQCVLVLAVLGYIPGFAMALGLYSLTKMATQLPIAMTLSRALTVLILTILICAFSGALTVSRLKQADPADIF